MVMLTSSHSGLSCSDIRNCVRTLLGIVWSGWGQANIVEELFKHMRERERETLDTFNEANGVMPYYASTSQMNAIAFHQRTETNVPDDQAKVKGKPNDISTRRHREPSLPDCHTITQTATWPTYSPQSSKNMFSDLILLRYLQHEDVSSNSDLWAMASKCWQCELVQYSFSLAVSCVTKNKRYLFVVGQLCHQVLMCWLIALVPLKGTTHFALLVGAGNVINIDPTSLCTLDVSAYAVVPTTAISPLRSYLARGKKVCHPMGVVLLQ